MAVEEAFKKLMSIFMVWETVLSASLLRQVSTVVASAVTLVFNCEFNKLKVSARVVVLASFRTLVPIIFVQRPIFVYQQIFNCYFAATTKEIVTILIIS